MIIGLDRMRSRLFPSFLLAVAFIPLLAHAADHTPPAAQPAANYSAQDAHPDVKVTIAADPCDTEQKCGFLRVHYLRADMMPIRVIVTNDGDRPVSLNDARIHLISAAGDQIPAAEPEDVERRSTRNGGGAANIPLPAPLPPIRRKPKNADKQIEQDFSELEYSALAVEPHTTRAGYLWYDLSGLGPTPLKGARLELRKLRDADGKELFAFEIPFDKYLAASH